MEYLFLKLLDSGLSTKLFSRLLEARNPVKMGLEGQYFVAYDLLADFDALISHGKKNKPDLVIE